MIASLILAIILWTALATRILLIGGGSTSVLTMLTAEIASYKHLVPKQPRVIYNAVGSAGALTGLRNNSYQFGFLSDPVNDMNAQKYWTQDKYVRFAIAQDNLVFVYHLPKQTTFVATPKKQSDILIDHRQQKHLVLGLNYPTEIPEPPNQQNTITAKLQALYLKHQSWSHVFADALTGSGAATQPYVLTREPGSGTRAFFTKIIGTKKISADQVVTSNGEMLTTIKKTPGAFGYLDFSFVKNIIAQDDQTINTCAVRTLTEKQGVLPYLITKTAHIIPNHMYNVNRPFVGLFNTKTKHYDANMRFLAWITNPYPTDYSLAFGTEPQASNAAFTINQTGEISLSTNNRLYQKYNCFSKINPNFAALAEKYYKNPALIPQAPTYLNIKSDLDSYSFAKESQNIFNTITNRVLPIPDGHEIPSSYQSSKLLLGLLRKNNPLFDQLCQETTNKNWWINNIGIKGIINPGTPSLQEFTLTNTAVSPHQSITIICYKK